MPGAAGPGKRARREAAGPGQGGRWKPGGLAGEAGVRRGPPRQGGHTHHWAHISCFSLLPRGAWQTLRRCTQQTQVTNPPGACPPPAPPPRPQTPTPQPSFPSRGWRGSGADTSPAVTPPPLSPCPLSPAHLQTNGSRGSIESSCSFVTFGSEMSLGTPSSRLPICPLRSGRAETRTQRWSWVRGFLALPRTGQQAQSPPSPPPTPRAESGHRSLTAAPGCPTGPMGPGGPGGPWGRKQSQRRQDKGRGREGLRFRDREEKSEG